MMVRLALLLNEEWSVPLVYTLAVFCFFLLQDIFEGGVLSSQSEMANGRS